jgi:putative acetyltransferase
MMRFSGFHAIAARRGDGLRPELMHLLERSRADAEAQQAIMLSIAIEAIDQDEIAELLRPTEDRRGPSMAVLIEQRARFFIARLDGVAIGCGSYVSDRNGVAELKRMFVDATARGHGIGLAILQAIEQVAKREGVRKMRLETGVLSVEARGLYARSGYNACGPFGEYGPDPQSVFMEKELT